MQKFYIPALTVMLRKKVFETVGYFDENLLIEDWDMWLRISHQFSIAYINDYLACYRIHATNASKIYSDRMITNRKKIIEKWKETPYYPAASSINQLLDGESIKQSWFTLIKHTWMALFNLKQPYRVMRLFLSNIRREYFSA